MPDEAMPEYEFPALAPKQCPECHKEFPSWKFPKKQRVCSDCRNKRNRENHIHTSAYGPYAVRKRRQTEKINNDN